MSNFVIDELFAYADSDNEVLMQKAIMELAKDKTTIMIAHRLSNIVMLTVSMLIIMVKLLRAERIKNY